MLSCQYQVHLLYQKINYLNFLHKTKPKPACLWMSYITLTYEEKFNFFVCLFFKVGYQKEKTFPKVLTLTLNLDVFEDSVHNFLYFGVKHSAVLKNEDTSDHSNSQQQINDLSFKSNFSQIRARSWKEAKYISKTIFLHSLESFQ